MKWKNENCNNGKPACKKGYENKYRTNFLHFTTESYGDNNLDLNINESPSKKILVLFFIYYLSV